MRSSRITVILVGFVTVNLATATAFAHSLYLFAAADGEKINGRVYLRGGTGVPDVIVKVYAEAKEAVGQVTTDSEGRFSFSAPYRCDYLLRAVMEDGHQAEALIHADELPATLPALPDQQTQAAVARPTESQTAGQTPGSAVSPADHPAKVSQSTSAAQSTGTNDESVRQEVASLRSQVIQLREDLKQLQTATGLRDILGGVGYILGLTGITFYFLAKRGRNK